MTSQSSIRTSVATLTLAAAVLLSGCGAERPGASITGPTTATTPAASATEARTPTPTAAPVVATCENTVTPDVLAALQADSYTGQPRTEAWLIADIPVDGGISCQWMVDHSVATDNFIWLSWAPMEAAQAEAAVAALTATGGWRREDAAEGVYMTANGGDMLPVTDENGYSTTYLFSGSDVKLAGTKAELVAITAPPGFTS